MDETSTRGPGLTRRRVVSVGAATAWTAPLVQLVSAAPALAASGPASLSVTATATRSGSTLAVASTIRNANTLGSTGLVVTLTVDPTDSYTGLFGALLNALLTFTNATASAAGYTLTSSTAVGRGRRFVLTAQSQVAGRAAKAFDPTVDLGMGLRATVTITASPGGTGTSGATTAQSA